MKSVKFISALAVTAILGGVGVFNSSVDATVIPDQQSTGTVQFNPGELTLDAVPTLDFGQHDITTSNETYNAQEKSTVTVSDLRGSAAGWNLTVKQENQLKTASSKELVGAQIKFASGSLVTTGTDSASVSDATLIPTTAVKIMDASVGQGTGTISGEWETSNVTLDVPGSSTKLAEKYTADLTWTLTDAPA